MGVELFLRGIIEPNTDNNASICPPNHFKLIFQTRLMQFEKKTTHRFLPFEEPYIEIELSL